MEIRGITDVCTILDFSRIEVRLTFDFNFYAFRIT